jgi:hypothetical protein
MHLFANESLIYGIEYPLIERYAYPVHHKTSRVMDGN